MIIFDWTRFLPGQNNKPAENKDYFVMCDEYKNYKILAEVEETTECKYRISIVESFLSDKLLPIAHIEKELLINGANDEPLELYLPDFSYAKSIVFNEITKRLGEIIEPFNGMIRAINKQSKNKRGKK